MSDKKKEFREMLKAAMKAKRIKQKRLADELGFDRDQRKWLGRLLKDGLERPNAKTIEDLMKLAEKLNMNIDLGVPYSYEARKIANLLTHYIARGPRVHPLSGQVRDWRMKWRHKNPQFRTVRALFSPNEVKQMIAEILGMTEIPDGNQGRTRYETIWTDIIWPQLQKHCEQRMALKQPTAPAQPESVSAPALYQRLEREYPAAFEIAVQKLGPEALKQMLETNVADGVDAHHLLWLIDKQFNADEFELEADG